MANLTRYVILDTDMGLDDAWALVMLLALVRTTKVKVLAVTCSFGNTDLDKALSNTIRTLDAMEMKVSLLMYNNELKFKRNP